MTWHDIRNAKMRWRTRRTRVDERGDTLIEILITLTILSLAGVALISGFSTSISASSEYRGLAVTDTVLRTVSEQVIGQFQQGSTFQPCDSAMDLVSMYETALAPALIIPAPYSNSADYVASVSNVTFWNGAGFVASCTPGSKVPQQITISLTGPFPVPQSVSFVVEGSGQIFSTGAVQLAPPTNVVPSTPGTVGDSGGLIVTFTGSSNAPPNVGTFIQYYTVKACTNSGMSQGCTPVSDEFQSGNELQGLVPGTPYWVTVFANASSGYLASSTAEGGPGTSSGTLSLPAVLSVTPSATTAGALVVTFTPPTAAPSGDTFTVTGCTDSAMSMNCVTESNYTSGAQFTGLTPGTKYYVEIAADPDGFYPGTTSLPYSPPVMATVQLAPATIVSVTSSQLQTGALVVSYTNSSNAPSGQTYTVQGCTDLAMTMGCVSQTSYASGTQFTGLTQGTSYYVIVTAAASTGYLASTSTPAGPTEATIQLSTPVIRSPNGVKSGTHNSGQIKVMFTGSSPAPGGQTYTLLACTDVAMTTGCYTNATYTSNASVGLPWASGTVVYVTITANASTGYLASAPSAQASGSAG